MIKSILFVFQLFLLFALPVKSVSGQEFHHQMLSSMGSTSASTTGFIFLQTVGQQSVIGNSSVDIINIQQSLISKILPVFNVNTSETTVYPNPFRDNFKISCSKLIAGEMSIGLYNMFGVQIFKDVKQDASLTIGYNFVYLPTGSYILNLTAKGYSYSKTIIKL